MMQTLPIDLNVLVFHFNVLNVILNSLVNSPIFLSEKYFGLFLQEASSNMKLEIMLSFLSKIISSCKSFRIGLVKDVCSDFALTLLLVQHVYLMDIIAEISTMACANTKVSIIPTTINLEA